MSNQTNDMLIESIYQKLNTAKDNVVYVKDFTPNELEFLETFESHSNRLLALREDGKLVGYMGACPNCLKVMCMCYEEDMERRSDPIRLEIKDYE